MFLFVITDDPSYAKANFKKVSIDTDPVPGTTSAWSSGFDRG